MVPHPDSSPVLLEGRGRAYFEAEARKFKAKLCTRLEDVVEADDTDIVCVLVEPSLAFDVIRRAATAGKHIVRDKPMVLTAEQADQVVALVERAGVKMTVGWGAYRFAPNRDELKASVEAVGDIAVINLVAPWGGGPLTGFTCSKDHHERYGGGEVHNFGGYALCLLRWLLGPRHRVRRVWAQMGTHFYPDYVEAGNEDLASLAFEFEGEVVGNIVTGRLPKACGMITELSVVGSKGAVHTGAIGGGGMGEVAADFVGAIRTGGQPAIDHRDGRAIHRALLAAYESARTGEVVELPAL
jgi:predicted dehydrogenase